MELKDIQLHDTMKRAMAKQAEAEREKRAKIISAEGESLAAAALDDASDTMMAHPLALQVRNLQSLVEIAVDKNSTVVFPAPLMSTIGELGSFLSREAAAAHEAAAEAELATVHTLAQPSGSAGAVGTSATSRARAGDSVSAGRGQSEQAQARAAGQFLRLALNLQLDALLFTVSADATRASSSMTSGAGREPDPPQWEHWLAGDLEAAVRLAESVVEEDLPLPAVLSGADQRAERVLDDLRARYAAILALLSEAAADVRQTPRVARTVSDLQKHYQERLRELGAGSVPHPTPRVVPPRRGDGATIG